VARAAYRIDRAGELRLDSMFLSNSWAGGVLIAPGADPPDGAGPDGGQDPHRGTPDGLARCAHTGGSPAVQEHVMSRSHHHQRHLHRIGTGLLRSDPQLAAMLDAFGRLSAGEAMPACPPSTPGTSRPPTSATPAR